MGTTLAAKAVVKVARAGVSAQGGFGCPVCFYRVGNARFSLTEDGGAFRFGWGYDKGGVLVHVIWPVWAGY